MIIWRGWGILVILVFAVCGGLAGSLSHGNLIAVGVGFAAGAAGIWYLGKWFNQTMPKEAYEKAVNLRAQELNRMVEVGAYQFPGLAAPRSIEEAHAQAEEQWKYEAETARRGYFNRHSLFFLPMQYWAFVAAFAAVATIISGLARG
ncbi:hypothetical protein [Paenarthrobacter sp. NPDC090522]|uniref:hypothetical protein n=1 Tax=Paenarthrobacter sp. NPDC090522 TaxID=3364383 RepID=UPI0038272AE1